MIKVAHPVHHWLPQTQAWLHALISSLPISVQPHVFCETTANLNQFCVENLYAARGLRRTVQSVARVSGLRRIPRFEARFCRMLGIDLIHSHFGNRAWRDVPLAEKLGIPHIATFYGYDVSMLPASSNTWKRRYLDLFSRVHTVLAEGPYMAQSLQKIGCPPGKLIVQHLGVDIRSIQFRPRKWNGSEPLRILISSSFVEKKGIPDAIHAIARAIPSKDVRLTIIGDATGENRSIREKQRIGQALVDTRLGPNTRMTGYLTHAAMTAESLKHHIFMAASKTAADGDTEGGAPVTILEMAASGMPVVSTRHADIPNVIDDPASGWLGDPGDCESIAEALTRCLSDLPRWMTVLETGRARMESEFDLSRQGERLAGIYLRIARDSGGFSQ